MKSAFFLIVSSGILGKGNKMSFASLFVFVGWGGLTFYGCWNNIRTTAKKIGCQQKYCFQHYVLPARWIRKLYKLDKYKIPKILYYLCHMAIACLVFGLVEWVLFCIDFPKLSVLVFLLHCTYTLIIGVALCVLPSSLKKGKKR